MSVALLQVLASLSLTLPGAIVHRSLNANVVRYDARVVDGRFDAKAPLDIYWLLLARDGKREELGWLDRTAYGAEGSLGPDGRTMKVVVRALRDRPISFRLVGDKVQVEMQINSATAILDDIFIQCGHITVQSIRLTGHRPTGELVTETIRK